MNLFRFAWRSRWGWLSLALMLNLAQSAQAQTLPYCQQSPGAIAQKEALRQAAFNGNAEAKKRYDALVGQHREQLRTCRQKAWPQTEATWIRLYPCDGREGVLETVLDRIVERGYNAVYVESFASSKVLLPGNSNPTPWASMMPEGGSDIDLLARVIQRGHDRGLKVYAWMFTLNFGADYFRRGDRQETLARNGLGKTSLSAAQSGGASGELSPDGAFVDPYSIRARQDYANLVRAIAQRKPDGILFDYVRYPLGRGGESVAGRVQDLWVYGDSSRQVLLQRALNQRGLALIQRYLQQGYVTANDVKATTAQFPKEGEPLWQGRDPRSNTSSLSPDKRAEALTTALWQLAVAHATQGVVDFLNAGVAAAKSSGVPTGVVFFPDGNNQVGQLGYDSRLQFWQNFPKTVDWHPMAYATCGNVNCIVAQLQKVLKTAPSGTRVKPVLAGIWQQSTDNRPPLETQMQAVYRLAPNLQSVSHFAYSWQEPGSDRDRKYCRL
ncbi:MAG TPA: hypothetical protein V6D18_19160 [Thermosynechococcaceae cyanobacterium]